MRNMNERPICHRGEDLVSYLYGEATATESRDFAEHMRLCDACRSEFRIFGEVHESIVEWRHEALGAVSLRTQIAQAESVISAKQSHARRMPALLAIREFFDVSPVWLRAATAVATVLFCLLAVLAVVRLRQRSTLVVNIPSNVRTYTPEQFNAEVAKQVDVRVEAIRRAEIQAKNEKIDSRRGANPPKPRQQLANSRLTRQEREQLAADLGLTSGSDEEELPFVLPEQPDQEKDN